MAEIVLPGPVRNYRLRPTLQLAEDLEDYGGTLFSIAEKILNREMKLAEVLQLLRIVYHAAGCRESIDNFILEKSPTLILADILTAILTPLYQIGAVQPGEALTAAAGK